ncbi:hypothetical protein CU044_5470 [Streptomyces sp. L-9-10]|uniref:hypothetical protein n=1 Tax=unclassified Streptomyces TaxID=2593676 RepID=UPI00101D4C42|nr:hypothetical protein [Streptomyces sp. L-9-10]RYJ23165.1 hypothetical protein CU044_5470 [Streptomyces sp. L-9-10]
MTTVPARFEILLVAEHTEGDEGPPSSANALRSALVEATGETGASGYPRYAGNGMEADIDPETRTVEALLIDGYEVDYGLSVRVVDAPAD